MSLLHVSTGTLELLGLSSRQPPRLRLAKAGPAFVARLAVFFRGGWHHGHSPWMGAEYNSPLASGTKGLSVPCILGTPGLCATP